MLLSSDSIEDHCYPVPPSSGAGGFPSYPTAAPLGVGVAASVLGDF